jgi:hypothetical protein
MKQNLKKQCTYSLCINSREKRINGSEEVLKDELDCIERGYNLSKEYPQ